MDFILYSCRPTPLGALSNPAMCLRLEPKDIEMVSEILNLETSSLTASGKKKTRLLGQRSHIFEFEKILSRSGLEYFSFFKKIDFLIEKGLNLNDIYIDNHGHFTSRGHQGFAEMIFENIDLKRAS